MVGGIRPLTGSAQIVAVTVALMTLHVTFSSLMEAAYLTDAGKELLRHPVAVALIAYGSAYAVLGDAAATASSMALLSIAGFYVLVLHPDLATRYVNVAYVKEKLSEKRKKDDGGAA